MERKEVDVFFALVALVFFGYTFVVGQFLLGFLGVIFLRALIVLERIERNLR
ncbi:MAG: hypothetical protein SXQ77_09060 [Halobacteria archaeon]|nr:hypothetical protein [Halobacteria archaeon]